MSDQQSKIQIYLVHNDIKHRETVNPPIGETGTREYLSKNAGMKFEVSQTDFPRVFVFTVHNESFSIFSKLLCIFVK